MLNLKGFNQPKLIGLVFLLLGWFCFGSTHLWADSNPEWIEFTSGMEDPSNQCSGVKF